MAVSIVNKQDGDDSQAPIIEPSTQESIFSPIIETSISPSSAINEDSFFAENVLVTQENKQEETASPVEETNNGRLNDLHPEQTTSPIQEDARVLEPMTESIPNMYIKADTETTDVPFDVAIFSEEKKEDDG